MQNGLKASGLSREKSREAERGRAGWKAGEDRKRARIARSKAGWTIELNTGDWPVGCWIRETLERGWTVAFQVVALQMLALQKVASQMLAFQMPYRWLPF